MTSPGVAEGDGRRAQTPDTSRRDAVAEFLSDLLDRRPAVGLALGVVRGSRLASFHGHGVADLASLAPITEETVFRVASITKTFTAIAVMQLCEQGRLDLDGPAVDYLGAYRLNPADPAFPPATVRHLLTHTAGLPELFHLRGVAMPDFGESVPAGERLPSLATLYGGALGIYAAPGTRFVYTNHGPSTLGQIVEDVTGEPLHRYLREHVFAPLGMQHTTLLRSEVDPGRLATGYEIGPRGLRSVTERDMATVGAAAAFSTPRDMASYLIALVNRGSNAHGSVLAPETLRIMFAPHYRPDPRVPGMGLGFFRYDVAGTVAVGHQGTHPGFHSQILVCPDSGVGVMAFTNGALQADLWLPAELQALLGSLLGGGGEPAAPVPHHPEVWGDLCGWYRLDARYSDVRLRGMIGAGAEVTVVGGAPRLRFLTPVPALYRGFSLHPHDAGDPRVFRIDFSATGPESMRVVFGQDAAGATDRLHLDLMPLTLRKQPASRNPRRWAAATSGAFGAVAATATVLRKRRR